MKYKINYSLFKLGYKLIDIFIEQQKMNLQVQQEDKYMITAKSTDCLRLDLNTRLEKKNQIKLLNAKLRTLKNKCRALRQQSKTDRQMLSNLINVTTHLENKTNEGIQACKEVQNELITKQTEIHTTDINKNIFQDMKNIKHLEIDSHCKNENNQEISNIENQIRENLQISLDLYVQKQNKIMCSAPTDRSITASMKSQGDQEEFLHQHNVISDQSGSYSDDSTLKRANTISYSSPKKSTKFYRKHSLTQSPSPSKRSRLLMKQSNHRLFINYIYAIMVTIVLTIILFKLI